MVCCQQVHWQKPTKLYCEKKEGFSNVVFWKTGPFPCSCPSTKVIWFKDNHFILSTFVSKMDWGWHVTLTSTLSFCRVEWMAREHWFPVTIIFDGDGVSKNAVVSLRFVVVKNTFFLMFCSRTLIGSVHLPHYPKRETKTLMPKLHNLLWNSDKWHSEHIIFEDLAYWNCWCGHWTHKNSWLMEKSTVFLIHQAIIVLWWWVTRGHKSIILSRSKNHSCLNQL